MMSAAYGETEVASLLIERGADLTAKDDDQQTAAMLAEHHYPELAAMLRKVSEANRRKDVKALAQR
jgi:ankyrin repeat protein